MRILLIFFSLMLFGNIVYAEDNEHALNKCMEIVNLDERQKCIVDVGLPAKLKEQEIRENERKARRTAIQNEIKAIQKSAQEQQEKERITRENSRKAREALIKQQTPDIQQLIKDKHVVLGMTKDVVRLSWGEPEHINRTVFPGRIHEQWVYSGAYLYFDNGILTSFQD